MKTCRYCQTKNDKKQVSCTACGAEFSSESEETTWIEYYMGYVIHIIKSVHTGDETLTFVFYLGDKVVERFSIEREVIRKFVPPYVSWMPFIFDLFKLAQGEEEVLRITEQNKMAPAVFDVRLADSARDYREALTLDLFREQFSDRRALYHFEAEAD